MRFLRALAALLACFIFATCGDSPTGPSAGNPRVTITIPSVASLVMSGHLKEFGIPNIDRVRAIVIRTPADTVADSTIVLATGQPALIFAAANGDITIELPVKLRVPGETFAFILEYRNSSGTVFRGEGKVQAHRASEPAPTAQPIPVDYAGPGAQAVHLTVTPRTTNLVAPASATFSAVATDSGGHAVTGILVRWSVSDTTVATIDPLSGALATTGKRGSVTVTAQTLTGLTDNVPASVTLPVSTLTLVSGGSQVGKAGTVLPSPAIVLVAAADGVGVPGVTVNFSAPVGASVGSTSAVTDSLGKASTSFTLGTSAGAQNFTATTGTLNLVIAESATAADAASIAIVSGDAQQDSVSAKLAPLKVRVSDSFNNPVSGVAVTWTRTSGAGSLESASTSTGADGVATNTYSLGTTAGSGSVSAAVGALSTSFSFTASSGAPAALAITSQPADAVAGSGLAVVRIALRDAFGNQTSSGNAVTIALGANSTGATLSGTSTHTAVAGVATFDDLKINKSGTGYTLVASATGLASATSGTFAVAAGSASAITIAGGNNQTAVVNSAVTVPPSVRVVDANDNPVAGIPVTFTAATGTVLPATPVVTNALGVAALTSWTLGTTAGSQTLNVSAPGLAGLSLVATAASGAATRVSVTNRAAMQTTTKSAAALDPQPEIRIVDQYGNAVAGAMTVTASSTNTSITLNGNSSVAVNATTGSAVFSGLSLSGAVGTTAIRFTASSGSISPDSTNTITLGVGTASQMIVTPPAGSPPAGYDFQVSARAADAGGNTVTTAAGSVTLALSGGTGSLTGTTTQPLVNGVATFSQLRVSAAGSAYLLTATQGSIVTASAPFAISAPLVLTANPSTSQDVQAGSATPVAPSVTITQSGATPSTNYVVTYSAAGSNGTVSKGSATNVTSVAVTAASGVAALDSWVVPNAEGTYQLTASIDGTSTSVTFSATVSDIHAMTFATTPGSSQSSGSALSAQPVIQLTDGAGHNVNKSGVTVTASVAPAPGVTGASFATSGTASATSNANGLVTFSNLGISGTSGLAARITFSVTGGTSQSISALTTDVTLSAGAAATVESNSPLAVSATVGNALSAGNYPALLFKDGSSNVVPNASPTVTFSITNGSCSVSGQPVSVNGSGIAALSATTLTVPASAGSCIVHAVTSPAVSGSPFDFRVVAAPSGAVVWSGLTDDNYATASNWIGGAVPTSSSAVFIPRWMIRSPKMQASQSVASLTMESGSTFDVASGNTLTVAGTIDAATITNGAVKAVATSSNVRGTFTAVALTFGDGTSACSYTMNGAATTTTGVPATSGNVALSSCSLDVSSQTLTVGRDLTVTGTNGKLVMQNSSGKVTVTGSATFNGASTSSDLTAGNLEIAGGFSQQSTVSTSSFAPSIAHTTKLNGTGAQSVAFADPTVSHFYNLNVTNSSFSGTDISTVAAVTNNFTLGSSATLSGSLKKLVVGGAVSASNSSDLRGLDSLEVTGNTFPNFLNTSASKSPKVTVLTGSAVALSANATVSGGLAIGTGGSLTIGARTLTVKDSLIVTGTIDMASSSGQIIVQGKVRFKGGSSSGHLQAGTFQAAGDFVEEGTSTTTFAPASGFLVQLNGTSSQQISFDHPGATSSRFANLEIDNTSSSGVSFQSSVYVTGNLEQKGKLQIASGRTATVDGTSSFRDPAITDVVGTFVLELADFYIGTNTTGTGTLTVASTCRYGSTITSSNLSVGGLFNTLTCVPGRGGSVPSLP